MLVGSELFVQVLWWLLLCNFNFIMGMSSADVNCQVNLLSYSISCEHFKSLSAKLKKIFLLFYLKIDRFKSAFYINVFCIFMQPIQGRKLTKFSFYTVYNPFNGGLHKFCQQSQLYKQEATTTFLTTYYKE